MIGPRWRKVLRDVWLHKPRTALVILAMAIGIVGAGSVLNTWTLVRQATRGEYGASNPASATLRTDSVDEALLQRVRALPAIRDAQARRTVMASANTDAGTYTAQLFATDDFSAIRIGAVKLEEGNWPSGDSALAIEKSSMDFSAVGLDGTVSMQIGSGVPQRLRVTGVARDVGLAPGWMEHVVYAFVSRQTLARLGAPSSLNELQIIVRDASLDQEGRRRVAYEVKALVEGLGHPVTDVNVPVPGQHIHAGQIESLLLTQGAFGILALLMSGILVVNLITAMLAGQVREIGIMKAVGARTGQVAWMYLGLALVLGLVATGIALPAAAFVGREYATFTADMLNFDVSSFTIPPRIIALQLAVGLLMPIAAASIPVLRGCRIPVGEALRDLGISGAQRADEGGWLIRHGGGISRPLLLSLRNAFRRRQRMALTLLTLSAGGAVYLGAVNLRASIISSVDLLFSTQKFDMSLRFAVPHEADSITAIVARVAGVARVEAWGAGRAAVTRPDGSLGNAFAVTAPPPDSRMLVPTMIEGRWLRPGDDRVIVVNRQLHVGDSSLVVGRTVNLTIAGQSSRWTVIGIAETGPSPAAYAPRATIAGLVTNGRVSRAVIAAGLRDPASQLELIQRLRNELQQAGLVVQSGQLMAQQRAVVEDHLLMVAGFLGSMSVLMIIVGGLGLASTMSLGVMERTREIGVMRAIGARHSAIISMIQIEGLIIALLSWALAIPISLPMSLALGRAFGRVMLPVPVIFTPEPGGVLRWLAVVIAVSLLACAWPALRAMRVTTAAALAYE